MRLPDEAPPWQDQAACAGVDPDLFFPKQGPRRTRPKQRGPSADSQVSNGAEAKSYCAACPVIRDCLIFGLAGRERFGIWGGAGDPIRRQLLRLTPDLEPDAHRRGCTCLFCLAVNEHVAEVRRAFVGREPAHGRWEARRHAGCGCQACATASRKAGRRRVG